MTEKFRSVEVTENSKSTDFKIRINFHSVKEFDYTVTEDVIAVCENVSEVPLISVNLMQ